MDGWMFQNVLRVLTVPTDLSGYRYRNLRPATTTAQHQQSFQTCILGVHGVVTATLIVLHSLLVVALLVTAVVVVESQSSGFTIFTQQTILCSHDEQRQQGSKMYHLSLSSFLRFGQSRDGRQTNVGSGRRLATHGYYGWSFCAQLVVWSAGDCQFAPGGAGTSLYRLSLDGLGTREMGRTIETGGGQLPHLSFGK